VRARGKAEDDIGIVERVRQGVPALEKHSSRLLARLGKVPTTAEELLSVKKIREMYQSMDGAILTSTIVNIDIE
jgi:hypothetical protein